MGAIGRCGCYIRLKTDPSVGHAGISAFIVEKGTPGFSAKTCPQNGIRTSPKSELVFRIVKFRLKNMSVSYEGNGFMTAMQTVEWDRKAPCGCSSDLFRF